MFNAEILAFILYFIVIVGIGVYFFAKDRKTNGEKEFFLGGRSMGPWVTAMSAQASDMSAWLLMGLPGSIMAFGFGQMWIGIGLALGTAANWIFVAKRLRKFSKAAGDAITLPQYLSNRFMAKSNTLQIICAVIFFVCFTVYVASGFVAGASVFTTVFPSLSTDTAMLVFALAMLACTFLGGFKAVCWTDFMQGLLMLAAVLAVPIVIVATQNLDTSALEAVYSYVDGASGQTVTCEFGTGIFDASAKDIISGLGWGLGYFGMPHILVRFMSIEKPSMIKKSATVAIIWVVLSLGATCLIAYFGRMLLAEELLTVGAQKTVFIAFARKLFPTFIAGILMAAILAASMSTADSQLLVASSSFTSDIYKPIIRKNASEKEVLWMGRLVVLIVAVIAYFIASSKAEGAQAIMNLVENAWAGFGSAFGPTIILSLFWRRFTYKGAIAGVATGAIVDVLWLAFMSSTGIYEIIPGFAAGLAAAVAATFLDKEPNKEVEEIFDRATAEEFDD
ncbi:MAG: sodium/proline symporter [Firmicutes bacterium]|nr:sodium/proline symporter [Bacillota bacterium]MDY5771052.1 sodium/proline symporter [Anaerovoracaceae bacterium]